jgi:VWFA-related protein
VKQNVLAGALALFSAIAVAQPQQQQTQQAIPDAPKPQLPAFKNVVPGEGTTSTSNGDTTPPDTFQPPVGNSLPQNAPAAVDTQTPPEVPAAGEGAGEVYKLTVRANEVVVPFTVKDSKGRLVPGLTWRDIRIYEDGYRQKMNVFTVDPFPLAVALVIDQSLPFDVMTKVNNALGALPGAFTDYDEVAVFTYNNGPKMETEFTAGPSARLSAVLEQSKKTGRDPMFYDTGTALGNNINLNNGAQSAINPLVNATHGQNGGSGIQNVPKEIHTLNDAILAAATATTKAGKERRRIVYVISDGKESGSTAKLKDVIKYLQTNKIAVYATLVGDSSVKGLGFIDKVHIPLMMRDNILPVYANATGGETYAEWRQKGIETSFAKITEEVRTQYTLGYTPSRPFTLDTKFRKLEVRVMRPNLQVIAKDGYYPSSTDFSPRVPIAATSLASQP